MLSKKASNSLSKTKVLQSQIYDNKKKYAFTKENEGFFGCDCCVIRAPRRGLREAPRRGLKSKKKVLKIVAIYNEFVLEKIVCQKSGVLQ